MTSMTSRSTVECKLHVRCIRSTVPDCVVASFGTEGRTARGDDPSLLRRSGRNIRSMVTWDATAADAKKRIGQRVVDCAVSFSFTMQVVELNPSMKPPKELKPTDLDEKLTALRRRTAG